VGIAVGMATSIPPHNLGELMDALIHLALHPNASLEDILTFVRAPDFPTGGVLFGARDIAQAYAQGVGSMVLRGRTEIVEERRHRAIVVTEIPYEVRKAALIEQIARCVREKRIEGIRDVRDESDKEGLRIVIELRSEASPQRVLNALFKLTDLQRTYHLNLLALVDGIQPRVLSLKDVLSEYLAHRREVIRRRSAYDLQRAQERSHILEGLAKALSKIDAVIRTIKLSRSRDDAHGALKRKFRLSDAQASAILALPLASLARLEREKIAAELGEQRKRIRELTEILKDPKKLTSVVVAEMRALKERFADERRTEVVAESPGEIKDEDLIPEAQTVIALTSEGYVKRMAPTAFHIQRRGGKGVVGVGVSEEERVSHFTVANTHDTILFFTDRGRVFKTPAYEIPEASRTSRGRAIVNLVALSGNERVAAIVAIPKAKKASGTIVLVTRLGIVKRVDIARLANIRRNGLSIMTVRAEDALGWAVVTSGEDELLIVTRKGMALRFSEREIRTMGREATGVRGIALRHGDAVSGVAVIGKDLMGAGLVSSSSERGKALQGGSRHALQRDSGHALRPALRQACATIVTEGGFGKRVALSSYRKQRRGGRGSRTITVNEKTGLVVDVAIARPDAEELIAVSSNGKTLRVRLGDIRLLGRTAQGTRIMRLSDHDTLASFSVL
jgi:DNA gyrase subunit A